MEYLIFKFYFMSKNKKRWKNRVRSIMRRVLIVGSDGVKFDFYQEWETPPTESELLGMRCEKELGQLEMKLNEC
jgi:hypothetical protein